MQDSMGATFTNPWTFECKNLFNWIDTYSIGSEGASAWCWRGEDMEDMRCIGFTGKTRKEAVEKVLYHIWTEEKLDV